MTNEPYDVFLSYNSNDAASAVELAELLRDTYGLRVWIDRWMLMPGDSWVDCLEDAIQRSNCLLSCVGGAGQGPWHQQETKLALRKRTLDSSFRLIPVLLPGATSSPGFPEFLAGYTWSDLRGGLSERLEIRRLVQGILSTRLNSHGIEDGTPPIVLPPGFGRQIVSLQRMARKQLLPAPLFHRISVHLHQGATTYAALVRNSRDSSMEIRLSPFEPRLWADLRVVEHASTAPITFGLLQEAGLFIVIRERVTGLGDSTLIRQIVGPSSITEVSEMDRFLATLGAQCGPLFTDSPEILSSEICSVTANGIYLSESLWRGLEQNCPDLVRPKSRFIVFSDPLRFMVRYLPAGDRVKRVRIRFSDDPGAFQKLEESLERVGLEQTAGMVIASVLGCELDLICSIPKNLSENTALAAILREIPRELEPDVVISDMQ